MNLLLLGAGYSARYVAQRCLAVASSITGTTRNKDRISDDSAWPLLHFDGEEVSTELRQAFAETTHLLVSVPPAREREIADPVLKALVPVLTTAPLQWIGYLSTVGVYGDHQGQWVDETTTCRPLSARSKKRLQAEGEWTALAQHREIPLTIFRLPGIYGPGRNALVRLEEGQSRQLIKPGQVFNRIHVDDLSAAVTASAIHETPGIYNITDDVPAPPQDVVSFAAHLMGKPTPEAVSWEDADISPMAKSFYAENKRVSNALSKTIPGMEYRFPDYQTGLRMLWDSGEWQEQDD